MIVMKEQDDACLGPRRKLWTRAATNLALIQTPAIIVQPLVIFQRRQEFIGVLMKMATN